MREVAEAIVEAGSEKFRELSRPVLLAEAKPEWGRGQRVYPEPAVTTVAG
jgi:hypothetical protein